MVSEGTRGTIPGVGNYYVIFGGPHQGVVRDRTRAVEFMQDKRTERCRRFANKVAAEASLMGAPVWKENGVIVDNEGSGIEVGKAAMVVKRESIPVGELARRLGLKGSAPGARMKEEDVEGGGEGGRSWKG